MAILIFIPDIFLTRNESIIIVGVMSISLIIQLLTAFLINHSKIKLIETAIEPLDQAIVDKMTSKTKDATKIKKFVFADIKPASLFLSAGVTNYSFKSNVCLVSRYFQWKLTEDELIAVLGHEIGHVVHRDMFQSKILVALQAIIRTLLFYFIIIFIQSIFNLSSVGTNLLSMQFTILILIIFTQMLLSFSLQLRMFNQEIMADEYGASLIGSYYNLAFTLKKLPKVIPAPVDDHPLNFLGFRIAILNLHAKMNNEVDNSPKEFSRFSNN